MIRIKFDSYNWNYTRLAEPLQKEFIDRFSTDFATHKLDGTLQKEYFEWYKWNTVHKIIRNPSRYHELAVRQKNGEEIPPFDEEERRVYLINGKEAPYLIAKLIGGYHCIQENGLWYTIKLFFKKVCRRFFK